MKSQNLQRIMTMLIAALSFIINSSMAQVSKDGYLYLNPEFGKDTNNGTKDSPLKSLYEAARRVNQANGKGAITIYLADGIYGLDATVTFHPAN